MLRTNILNISMDYNLSIFWKNVRGWNIYSRGLMRNMYRIVYIQVYSVYYKIDNWDSHTRTFVRAGDVAHCQNACLALTRLKFNLQYHTHHKTLVKFVMVRPYNGIVLMFLCFCFHSNVSQIFLIGKSCMISLFECKVFHVFVCEINRHKYI